MKRLKTFLPELYSISEEAWIRGVGVGGEEPAGDVRFSPSGLAELPPCHREEEEPKMKNRSDVIG